MIQLRILEIGCGIDPFPFDAIHETIRVDWNPEHANIVHDLNIFPYPFNDDYFDLIYSSHCIEHLKDKTKVFWEIFRILKKDGVAVIRVPHITSSQAFNYDHESFWRLGSMNCFTNAKWYGANNFPHFKLISEQLTWRNSNSPLRYPGGYPEKYATETKKKKYPLIKVLTDLLNIRKGFSEMFLFYWVYGIEEIEYVITPIKD